MTYELKQAIDRAMSAMLAVDFILDGGDPDKIGDIDDADAEVLLNLSDLAGEVSNHADDLFNLTHKLSLE